ncbi:MAG: glutamate racemase [Halomonadaceae bacterium]|nr:MAG: glutamate racemase [Halomonadaceae bacterium]
MRPLAPRILVFDSGVGGLSIARAIWQQLPRARLLYLADNAHFPYGDQPDQAVISRCLTLVQGLLAQQPADMVVIGCNTASTLVLPALRAAVKLPVVGVVPAIKPAAALSRNHRLGLLATPATVRRPYLDQLIREFSPDCDWVRVGSSALVQLVEDSLESGTVNAATLARITEPLRQGEVDTVVLGCTHFPLIQAALAATMGPEVVWVDSGEAIARRVVSLMDNPGLGGLSGEARAKMADHQLFFTAAPPKGLGVWLQRHSVGDAGVTGYWGG